MTSSSDDVELKFAVSACAVEQVVVYADRAEVTRRVELDGAVAPLSSTCAVLITGISSRMDADSVRVKGTGAATILEVGTDVAFDADESDTAVTARERTRLETDLRAKRKEKAATDSALARARTERELLVKYAETSASPGRSEAQFGTASPGLIDPAAMQKVLEFYAERTAALDDRAAGLLEEARDADERIRELEQRLSRLRPPPKRRSQTVRVRLGLSAPVAKGSGAPVSLRFTYMVSGASWQPSYDARADLEGGERALGLQLSYYGMVTNCTGEDWTATRLSLSTAQPATGGQPPTLPTVIVGWKPRPIATPAARSRRFRGCASAAEESCAVPAQALMSAGAPGGYSNACLGRDEDEAEACFGGMPPSAPLGASTSAVTDGSGHAGAARFEVEHVSTIHSDGAAHKVTVGVLELQPSVHHFAAPALEARAYLQACVSNTSSYPLLESKNCSVFVDGSFVCKSTLPHTMPGEQFVLFLGPDPSLKVECRPAVTRDATHGEGALFRAATRTTLTERTVVLCNTRANRPARVHVAMCLPRASDEKIKVTPVEPPVSEIRQSDASGTAPEMLPVAAADHGKVRTSPSGSSAVVTAIVQNRVTNNLVWMLEMQPAAKHTIAFKYRVEHPADRDVATTEVMTSPTDH
eukprot:CAMPEP_0119414678 /NCGR_PEP_ID=MMETSP1335-20130426/7115_1 /TAXON_ID=259385 /ORGANISM="Chrysoculter rhomboideus, Strain RCC1486" /LENGTH=642 /DNA_ID=CAMNT_0007439565 /DNA_START=123 /DNA_END=2051 /DNA_ORIENTATION=+